MQKLIKLMRNSKLDASGTMNRETINGLTSFKDAASFSLVKVSPAVLPWGPEKSFRVNFHSRDRADRARGTFRGLRKTTSTMMGSVMQKQQRSQCINSKRWETGTTHASDLRMYQLSCYSKTTKGSINPDVSIQKNYNFTEELQGYQLTCRQPITMHH